MTLNQPSPLPSSEAQEALARPRGQTEAFRVAQPFAGVLAAGSRFGDYTIRACIGEGGMARVYSAEHEGLKRPVALKVLLDGRDQHNAHQRFLREACLAAAIKHPNVVNIFDVGVHQGTPYLVMELLEGMDLEALVRAKGRLDEASLMDILVPIAAGLAAVHDAGIVHRDLKPSNIFLARGRDEEVEPRLLDFGISKSLGADDLKLTSARGSLLGTPFYMAPEGVNGGEMTPLSDQYALGVVLYECATGVNPFAEASSFSDVVRRVGLGQLPAVASQNPELSPRLVAVIERAMQLDPARRFPDVRALGRELLLLAGQRTRVAWNLSFTVLAARGAQTRALGASSASAAEAPLAKRSRGMRWLPWAALVMAALSFSGLGPQTGQLPESSPLSSVERDVVQAVLPAQAASQTRDPGQASDAIEEQVVEEQVVQGQVVEEPVPMLAAKPAARSTPVPAEPRAARPRPASRPRVAPAGERAQPPGVAQPPVATPFGTNHAPIFD